MKANHAYFSVDGIRYKSSPITITVSVPIYVTTVAGRLLRESTIAPAINANGKQAMKPNERTSLALKARPIQKPSNFPNTSKTPDATVKIENRLVVVAVMADSLKLPEVLGMFP
jgi:hypothetical protein